MIWAEANPETKASNRAALKAEREDAKLKGTMKGIAARFDFLDGFE